MFDDIKAYQWNDVNENTSIGERISYMRMGWYYMTLRPMTGWKNLDFLVHKDDPQITKHASPEIRVGVKGGGFHNEYITNAVQYGLPGLLYTLFLFIGPGLFFIFHLTVEPSSKVGLAGLVLIITQSISSLSYQVLDFKFTASLYAMMIIAFAAAAMHEKKRSYFKLGEH
jgi:O-antigen ligase